MDDYQDPKDIPEPAGSANTHDKSVKPAVDERRDDESGPDASDAPEEEGSASPG